MSNCYTVDERGNITKLSTAEVKAIAIRNGVAVNKELTLEQAKDFICGRLGNPECDNVCFSFEEAKEMAEARLARYEF